MIKFLLILIIIKTIYLTNVPLTANAATLTSKPLSTASSFKGHKKAKASNNADGKRESNYKLALTMFNVTFFICFNDQTCAVVRQIDVDEGFQLNCKHLRLKVLAHSLAEATHYYLDMGFNYFLSDTQKYGDVCRIYKKYILNDEEVLLEMFDTLFIVKQKDAWKTIQWENGNF